MKLNKVISLVLGGAMALSMLTACGSDSETSSTLVETLTENSGVVAYIQSEMDKDDVGDTQVAVTLSGQEDEDLEEVIAQLKSASLQVVTLSNVENGSAAAVGDHKTAGATYVYAVAKGSSDDEDLGDAILARMKALNNAGGRYIYAKISVFDAEMINNTGNSTTWNVNGTTVYDSTVTEYWIVVVTTGGAQTF